MTATRPEKIKYIQAASLEQLESDVNEILKGNSPSRVDNWRLGAPLQYLGNFWIQTLVRTPE